MATMTLSPKSTMKEILEAYPAAKQALFEKYHIGGCSSCGFSPDDSLEAVLAKQGAADPNEAVALILKAEEENARLQLGPKELEALLRDGSVKLIDVRTEAEHRMVRIEGDVLATQELAEEILDTWPKDSAMVLYCHTGSRSLQAARNLAAQGFTNVKSLRGGVDAWSEQVDPLLPRY